MSIGPRSTAAEPSKPARVRLSASALTIVLLGLALTDVPSHAASGVSTDGLYTVAWSSELEPLAINRLHRWTLTLTDSDGEPVEAATFVVTGGMPEHNHGLPTRPQVTRYLGDGRYLLEGMRFHMQGDWTISIAIDSPRGRDTVVLELTIER